MGLFGALVRTAVNTAILPVSIATDVVTFGGAFNDHGSYTLKQLATLKREASED